MANLSAIIRQIDTSSRQCQTIILTPSPKLAKEVAAEVMGWADSKMPSLICHLSIGSALNEDIRKGVHLVVGIPARVKFDIKRKALPTEKIDIVVIVENDDIVSKGLKTQIHDILKNLKQTIKVILLSATIPSKVLDVITYSTTDRISIVVKKEDLMQSNQFFISMTRNESKFDIIHNLFSTLTTFRAVIFCNTRRNVDHIAEKLEREGIGLSMIHGDHTRNQRDIRLRQFKTGLNRLLITTEVFAPIDGQQIQMIINYDLPTNTETMNNRIGRLNRSAKREMIINLVTIKEMKRMKGFEVFETTVLPFPRDLNQLL